MIERTVRYTKGDIAILWKPHLCAHSGNCFKGLPAVFNPNRKPWIDQEAAGKQEIIRQIAACPSGALSYIDLTNPSDNTKMENNNTSVKVLENGPYIINGKIILIDKDGKEEIKEGKVSLCRCGLSKNKPFCDGTHRTSDVLNS